MQTVKQPKLPTRERKSNPNAEQYYIPTPPKEIFEYEETPEEDIVKENTHTFIVDYIDISNGVKVYYKGVPFPRKGFPFPAGVSAINTAKRALIELIKIGALKQFILGWTMIVVSPYRIKLLERIIGAYTRITYSVVSQYIVKPQHMTPVASELQGTIFVFLARLGVSHGTSKQFARIFGAIIEYDNAYRYRLEDLFSETTKERLMENPRKECKRLLTILLQRDRYPTVREKFKNIFSLLSLPLLFPSVKKAFRSALKTTDFKRLQYDKDDLYWVSMRNDYHYQGLSLEERLDELHASGYNLPQGVEIDV